MLGSIYAGIATPPRRPRWACRRAGPGRAQGSLDLANLSQSLMGATRTSCMIALILVGAAFLTLAMGFTGLPRHLAEWIGR